jgi:uncharacterized protein YjiS (DUF1127 family)
MKSLTLTGALRPGRRYSHKPGILAVLLERHRYRSNLKRLLETSPHLLADVGLCHHDAVREVNKALWQA